MRQGTDYKATASEADRRPEREPGQEKRVSRRAVLIGLALVPLNVYWVIVSELRWYVILTLNPLFVTPIFYLTLLVLANAVIRRLSPRHVLSKAEMITIYVMLVVSCTIATHDFIINLMSTMGYARWFATPENRWETTVFPHLPKWLLVWDKGLLAGYFSGDRTIWDLDTLRMWFAPLAFWSIFIFTVGWMMFCLNVLLRKAWTDETKLAFPIVRLPLALLEENSPNSTLRSTALWLGFAVAAGLGILNGLHDWYPSIPYFQTRARWIVFPNPPLNATWPMAASFYPFAIGLAFLVPLDVSFSCWFFYLLAKAQSVVGYQMGYGSVPDFPFLMEQGIGAWIAFGVALLYMSRRYLARVIKSALGPGDGLDAREPLSYRLAFWGLIGGMLVFLAFWRFAGMSPMWALVVLLCYLLLALCITRARAEAGGQHTVWDLEPKNLFRLFDSNTLGPSNLATAAVSHWYWRLNRSHMMPSQLEAFKLAQEHRVNLRSLVFPMLAALALATVCGMWTSLHVLYREGAMKCAGWASWTNCESYDWLGNALHAGFRAEPGRWVAIAGAAGLVALLAWLRARFVWFPFHPLGYCIGPGLIWLWCPFLIAWAAKLVILRYGGLRMYRRAVPFFLGLVLGDYTVSALWSLIGVIWHVPTYQIFH